MMACNNVHVHLTIKVKYFMHGVDNDILYINKKSTTSLMRLKAHIFSIVL